MEKKVAKELSVTHELTINSAADVESFKSVTGIAASVGKEAGVPIVRFPDGNTFALGGKPIQVQVLEDKSLKISKK